MARHLFDFTEAATHNLVADQLRSLAEQLATGQLDLSYDEDQGPTEVRDPVDVVVDLKQKAREVVLVIELRWPRVAV